jgi:transposase
MIRIDLTEEQRQELERLRHAAKTTAVVRARCRMLRLSADGWSAPRIANQLKYHPHTVRDVLHRFQAHGLAGLMPDPPGPAPNTSRREQVTAALGRLLDQERTWTAAQLATALGDEGIALSTRQTRKYLQRRGARWRRTVRSLQHKQDPERVAKAEQTLAALKGGPKRAASASPFSMSAASPPASR